MYKVIWSKLSLILGLFGVLLGYGLGSLISIIATGEVAGHYIQAECIVLQVGQKHGLLTAAQRFVLTESPDGHEIVREFARYLRSDCRKLPD